MSSNTNYQSVLDLCDEDEIPLITGKGFFLRCPDDADTQKRITEEGAFLPGDGERYILTTLLLEGFQFVVDKTTPPPFPIYGEEFGGYVDVKSRDFARFMRRWREVAGVWNAYHDYAELWKASLPEGDFDDHDPVLYYKVKRVSGKRFRKLKQQVRALNNPTNDNDRKVVEDYKRVFAWFIAACLEVPYGKTF